MSVLSLRAGTRARVMEMRGVRVRLDNGPTILSDADLAVDAGEIVALIGESGAGKTTLANAVLGHARAGARIVAGSVVVDGADLLALPDDRLRLARGSRVAHVPQDPGGALNPMMRIGAHLDEMLRIHQSGLDPRSRRERIAARMAEVDLPATPEFLRRFPHQLSGGQQQRVLLALAFLLDPRLIVLDEPTTALDPHVEALILRRLRDLCRRHGAGAIYVSHNLAVVRALADRVVVLYAGRVVEEATTAQFFARPAHPYGRGLVAAVPDMLHRRLPQAIPGRPPKLSERPEGCGFASRCDLATAECDRLPPVLAIGDGHHVACIRPHHMDAPALPATRAPAAPSAVPPLLTLERVSARRDDVPVLHDISLMLRDGACTALLGASGSGKTTLSRVVGGLGAATAGVARFDGSVLPIDGRARSPEQRQAIQYVFQNALRALNPRHSVERILVSAIRHIDGVDAAAARRRAGGLLGEVALGDDVLRRRPSDLSGGERQRIAIARGLVARPRLLICDEITSALDVSVQAAILGMLDGLRRRGLTILLVTHDLGVVRTIADEVVVLGEGRIAEAGEAAALLDRPDSAEMKRLVVPLADTAGTRMRGTG